MMLELLHVDDEEDIREVASLALGLDPQISMRSAGSGQEALAVLDGGYRPDVILLDVMMPVLDGPGTLAQLRERSGLTEVPVIFMTARAQTHEREQYLAAGAIGVIIKPFDPMTLAQDVRAMLKRANG